MLKFIGTGDMANVELGNTSAYIKNEDKILIIDCGASAFQRMIELNLFDGINEINVAVTHNHPDHVGSLASLIFYAKHWLKKPVNVVVSSDEDCYQMEDLESILSLQGVSEESYTFVNDVDFNSMGLTLKYEKIQHSKLESFAICITSNDSTAYYLGDNNDIEYLKSKLDILNKNDLIYTDCTTFVYETSVHMTLQTLCENIDEKLRKQVVCMHFCDGENIEEIKRQGFAVAKKEQSKQEYLKRIMSHEKTAN